MKMKCVAIASLAVLGIVATGRPASAQSGSPDFDSALLSVASPASQIVTAGVGTASIETPEGVEAPEAVEAAEAPGDTGPNVDHQFEGEETGENGSGGGG